METRDPDDVLTLCLLAAHPTVELSAVTVNPGTSAQIGVVRTILERLGSAIAVGSRTTQHPGRDAVSPFHRDWLGETAGSAPDHVAHELLARELALEPDTVLLSAAPVHNVRLLLRNHPEIIVWHWVAQGGFAGDNIVPARYRSPKFAGLTTCESFNFGHDPKGALAALSTDRIHHKLLISKNVTHQVTWDGTLHARINVAR